MDPAAPQATPSLDATAAPSAAPESAPSPSLDATSAPSAAPESTPPAALEPAPPALMPRVVTVKPGHVQPLWAGHPWVFQQAVDRHDDGIEAGDDVLVADPNGKILGRGLCAPKSAIAVRLFTSRGTEAVDAALFRRRIEAAIQLRRAIGLPDESDATKTTGYRLVHGEGDGLPGLIVDKFDDVLVVQLGTLGLKRREADIVGALVELCQPRVILDRTPKSLAKSEGFDVDGNEPRVLHGELPDTLSFHELGLRYELPLALAQKTGFYFDQRPLRRFVASVSGGKCVLDAFTYSGAIGLNAAEGGASRVWGVDKSEPAVLTATHTAALNGHAEVAAFEVMDANVAFKKAAADGGFDLVVCDPPKLATGRKVRDEALHAYRKLAAGACQAARTGGLVAICSCSGSVSSELLQRCLALGARDVGRRAIVVERLYQGGDHPVPAAFPDGLYLKVLVARVEALTP